jgi:PncC family amidohydrolase
MFPQEHDALAAAVGEALVEHEAHVAVVETTAGGLIAVRMLSVPGASRWFERGVVAYTRAAKAEVSERAEAVMAEHGAVSPEAVRELAERFRERTGATYTVAESGIAGPQDGRRSSKPVGSAAIAVATPNGTAVEERVFPGTRVEVMTQIAQHALEMLHRVLVGEA